jgi:ketosteroid isomerase-like protein
MRSWKCRITAASLPGIEMASASPSAVTGKYLAVWEKIGNDWKLAADIWNDGK